MANDTEINAKISAQVDGLTQGMEKAKVSVGGATAYMRQSFDGLGSVVERVRGPFLAFFAIMEGGQWFKHAIASTVEYGMNLEVMHQKTGMAVEDLSRLQYAANLSEVDIGALTMGLRKLSQAMEESLITPSSRATQAFQRLHVQVADGHNRLRSYNQVLGDLAERFQKLPDGPTKSALAMDIFGRAGTSLIPMLNQGRQGLADLEAEADRLGVTMSERDVRAVQEYEDSMKRFHAQVQAVTREFAVGLMPALTEIASGFDQGAKAGEGFRQVGEAIGKTLQAVVAVAVTLVAWYSALLTTMKAIVTFNFHGYWAQVKADMQAVVDTWKEVFSSFKTPLPLPKRGGGEEAPAVASDKSGAEEAIKAAEAHQLALLAIDKENADLQAKLGETNAEQQLAQAEAFAQREYDIKKSALEQLLKLYEDEPKKKAQIQREIAALADQQALEVTKAANKATLAIWKDWNETMKKVTDTFVNAWDKAYRYSQQHGATFGSFMRNLMQQLALEAEKFGLKELGAFAAKEAAKRNITVGSAALWVATETAAAAKTLAVHAAAAIAWVGNEAVKAGAAAWAALSEVPFVGPFLAPAAAAATIAGVMSLSGMIRSAAGGFDVPAGLNPMTQLHAREMVLPSRYADIIRGMGDGRGGGGGGGTTHIHIHAMDAATSHDWIRNNRAAFVKEVHGALGSGGFDKTLRRNG